MSGQDNAEFARTVYAAFNRSDFEAALAVATDDIELVTYAFDRTQYGLEGFRAYMAGWKVMAPDGRVEIVSQLTAPDGVTNECIFRGTNTGPVLTADGELPPTGRTFAVPFCEVWQIQDGKLASLHNYSDSLTILAQLGLLPAPDAAVR